MAQKLISAGMYRDPQVSIQITESPNEFVTVIGEIHGIVPIVGEKRLFDVLAAASGGGLPNSATTIVVGGGGLPSTASHIMYDQSLWREGTDHGGHRNRPGEEHCGKYTDLSAR
ncbi:MAG: hypothetical protein WDN23_16115 [Edaphobacter sp.]